MTALTTLATRLEDGILVLTLNRPEQLNAFTVTMADELEATFRAASEDDAVRAIVVTGAAAPSAPAWTCRCRAMCSGWTKRSSRPWITDCP